MRSTNTEQGIAIVEFVIVLPLLLLLMLATAEFGRALYQYNTLIKAVRDGARYMAQNAFLGDSAKVSTAAKVATQRLVAYGAPGKTTCDGTGPCGDLPGFNSTMVQTPDPFLVDDRYYVTVSATYTYEPMLGDILPLTSIGMNIPLGASTTTRVLSP